MESMEMSPEFWAGKRVLLTGHTGFKGSWLTLYLQNLGAKVYGFSLAPSTTPNLFTVADIAKNLAGNYIADIRDATSLENAMIQSQPDVIFHLAAQALVKNSYIDPVETYSTNVMGTVNLFEAVRKTASVKAVVNVTSDKCYENREWFWSYREDEAMGGFDPYSSSKSCSELITAAYRQSFLSEAKVAVATARAGNVIGGGDWALNRLIPDILNAFENGNSVALRYPASVRPWQHVLEPLSGYSALAQLLFEKGGEYAEAWNFGPRDQDCKSVAWIAEAIAQHWGKGASWHTDTNNHMHEASQLKLDISKAQARMNWQPHWDINKSIQSIVDWHKAYKSNTDMQKFCISQIQDFNLTQLKR
jgi:CDP-glucose 4,6-dehydratase